MGRVISAIMIAGSIIVALAIGGKQGVASEASLELRIVSADVSSRGVDIAYELINAGEKAVYFVLPDPAAGFENWLKVPFVAFDDTAGTLELSSYIAMPTDGVLREALFIHPVMKLNPGDYAGAITLPSPVYSYPPYSGPPPAMLDLEKIKNVRLRLGIIPCEDMSKVIDRVPGGPGFDYVAGHTVLDCNGEKKTVFEFQVYLTGMKTVRR